VTTQTIGLTGPCNWPNSGCPFCDDCDSLTGSQRAEIEAWAKSDLWEATGRVFGTCDVSVLPCNDNRILCGSCWHSLRSCGCRSVPEIKLAGPVHSITSVTIDGVELAATDYRVDDWQWLVRLDGGTWPTNNDPLDPDSFRVDYLLGEEPPAGAGLVTGMLVCSRSMCSGNGCRIPKRAREVVRQGVTMIMAEDEPFGIPDVDNWVRNAKAPSVAGAVHSPDLPSVRQITWETPSSP
jgi:hypothetical protein